MVDIFYGLFDFFILAIYMYYCTQYGHLQSVLIEYNYKMRSKEIGARNENEEEAYKKGKTATDKS